MWEVLAKIMEERGLAIADLVKGTGLSFSTFTDWRAGRYRPKVEKRQKVADFLGISLHYLDTGEREPEALNMVKGLADRAEIRDLVEAALYCDRDTVMLAVQMLQRMQRR